MATDKFFEFDRIYVNQGLNFVLESHAILCGMLSNSSVVLTSGINIVSFRIWGSSWSCRNNRNLIILDQYGEQFFIGHRKCVVHFGSFSLYCPGDSLNRSLDHVFVQTSGVKENWPRELGHTMMNEENLWWAHLVPYVTFFWFFSLQTLLEHAHREQFFSSPSCLP